MRAVRYSDSSANATRARAQIDGAVADGLPGRMCRMSLYACDATLTPRGTPSPAAQEPSCDGYPRKFPPPVVGTSRPAPVRAYDQWQDARRAYNGSRSAADVLPPR